MSPLIRLATPRDAAAICDIYAPIVRQTAISFEMTPPGDAEMVQRMSAVNAFGLWIVAEQGPDLLGYAYAGQFRTRHAYNWTTEFAVYVHADHRRRGVARGLYTALLAATRLQGFRLAVAGITLPNPESVAAHEAVGFRPVGVFPACGLKFGRWHDVGFWQQALAPADGDRPPTRRVAELVGTPGLASALAAGQGLIRAGG